MQIEFIDIKIKNSRNKDEYVVIVMFKNNKKRKWYSDIDGNGSIPEKFFDTNLEEQVLKSIKSHVKNN